MEALYDIGEIWVSRLMCVVNQGNGVGSIAEVFLPPSLFSIPTVEQRPNRRSVACPKTLGACTFRDMPVQVRGRCSESGYIVYLTANFISSGQEYTGQGSTTFDPEKPCQFGLWCDGIHC